jgi:hypothetical protein
VTTPPAAKPPRSALVTFTQATLLFEAFATLFAALVLWGLGKGGHVDIDAGLVWGGGGALAVLFVVASGAASRRAGRILGWILHLPLIAAGVFETTIAVVGVMFLGVYALGVRLGSRIDRERAERAVAEGDTE